MRKGGARAGRLVIPPVCLFSECSCAWVQPGKEETEKLVTWMVRCQQGCSGHRFLCIAPDPAAPPPPSDRCEARAGAHTIPPVALPGICSDPTLCTHPWATAGHSVDHRVNGWIKVPPQGDCAPQVSGGHEGSHSHLVPGFAAGGPGQVDFGSTHNSP